MSTFNSNNFIKSLKKGYEGITYIGGEDASKAMVGRSIKSTGFESGDVLSFIYSTMGLSNTLNEAEWKKVIDRAIKNGDLVGKNLEHFKKALKGKLSYEEMFNLAASCCGENAEALKNELCLNQIGWDNIVKTLIGKKEGVKETKKEEPIKEAKKSSIKSSSVDSRAIAIIGIKDDVRKEWNSFRACEVETGAGHGTVSQYFSGKVKSVKGWKLYKKGEEPKIKIEKKGKERKEHKVKQLNNKKAIIQIRITKTGKEKVVRRFNSITEAANATGINHSSISKAISGIYNSAGGCKWREKSAEAAA